MIEKWQDLSPAGRAVFDDIIDVRSPAEYAEDHIPGAINLPALSDEERVLVGTIYKQVAPFEARRRGAAILARNVARHLDGALMDKPGGWRPLIYCWRGGQRSGGFATVLSAVGWRIAVVDGGWKRWRRLVTAGLGPDATPRPRLLLVDGQTGVGKTIVLNRARDHGAQVLDLEGLAAHRGSVFGAHADEAQPSQKCFESMIFEKLQSFDLSRPILVEAESNIIGARRIPPLLWGAMKTAPCVELTASTSARAKFTLAHYQDFVTKPARIEAALDGIARFQPKDRMEEWRALLAAGAYKDLCASLMTHHYDPLYGRSRKRREGAPVAQIDLADMSEQALNAAAAEVAGHASEMPAS